MQHQPIPATPGLHQLVVAPLRFGHGGLFAGQDLLEALEVSNELDCGCLPLRPRRGCSCRSN
jgi:hypothetical protein